MINRDWKYFNLGRLFNTKKAYAYNNETLPESQIGENTINCITRTTLNNGCDYKVDRSEDLKVEKGNALTIGGEGIICFYQREDFVCGTNMTVLRNDNLNEYNGLFIATIINFYSKGRFSYGRAFNKKQIDKTFIKLPVLNIEDTEPDWNMMSNYIKDIYNNNLVFANQTNHFDLDISKWKEFSYKEVFDEIYKGTAHTKESIELCDCKNESKILYVTRTDLNNGAVGFAIKDSSLDIERGTAIIIGDTTATCFYQENEFITGDHIVILRSSHLNKYAGLFISTMVKNEKYRFSYGRAFKKSLIEQSTILLPQTIEGNIDWKYMEDFIKSMKFGNLI